MRDLLHKFLLLCGAALVVLRFIPSEKAEFLPKLFFDNVVHERISAFSMKVIAGLGMTGDQYHAQIAGLTSLAHAAALILEALGIALTCYIITRWI